MIASITLDTISTVASALGSTTIAAVALVFAYRQNVGWKPIILAHKESLVARSGAANLTLSVTIEFWNRRRYPVVVRGYAARVSGVTIVDENSQKDTGGYVRDNKFRKRTEAIVSPQERLDLEVAVEFENQCLDAMRPVFVMGVTYFDPYLNRTAKRKLEYRFFYPELGWSKSEHERAAAIATYARRHPAPLQERPTVEADDRKTLTDRDLLSAYEKTSGRPGDPIADALLDEIKKRGLDI